MIDSYYKSFLFHLNTKTVKYLSSRSFYSSPHYPNPKFPLLSPSSVTSCIKYPVSLVGHLNLTGMFDNMEANFKRLQSTDQIDKLIHQFDVVCKRLYNKNFSIDDVRNFSMYFHSWLLLCNNVKLPVNFYILNQDRVVNFINSSICHEISLLINPETDYQLIPRLLEAYGIFIYHQLNKTGYSGLEYFSKKGQLLPRTHNVLVTNRMMFLDTLVMSYFPSKAHSPKRIKIFSNVLSLCELCLKANGTLEQVARITKFTISQKATLVQTRALNETFFNQKLQENINLLQIFTNSEEHYHPLVYVFLTLCYDIFLYHKSINSNFNGIEKYLVSDILNVNQ